MEIRGTLVLELRACSSGLIKENKSLIIFSAVFHLNSEGSNMTTLWAAEAGLYVGIDNRGNIVTSVSSHSTLAKFILSKK